MAAGLLVLNFNPRVQPVPGAPAAPGEAPALLWAAKPGLEFHQEALPAKPGFRLQLAELVYAVVSLSAEPWGGIPPAPHR